MSERTAVREQRKESARQAVQSTGRAGLSSAGLSPADCIFFLQRTMGNQAVRRLFKAGLLQPKLKTGAPNDICEQEADRAAGEMMRPQQGSSVDVQRSAIIRRKDPVVQPHPGLSPVLCPRDEEKADERSRATDAGTEVPGPSVNDTFLSSLGAGRSLDRTARNYFEPRFGHDFSRVRVHSYARAAESAASIDARAYTFGNNIVFGAGEYQPETTRGKRLLAHELTHVVQQGAAPIGPAVIQREDFVPWPGQAGHDVPGTRETSGAIIREQVQRTGDPAYASLGPMLLEFDTRSCQLTVRKEINFVRAGTGENRLSEPDFNALKERILRIAREQLNGWITIRVARSDGCTLSCNDGVIGVNVVTAEGTGSYSSTVNLLPSYGREDAANIGNDASNRTIWHELGHIVLGAADEYAERRRPDGTPRPPSRVSQSDWSIMSSEGNARRALMHSRHFSHLPAWLGRRFPRCSFALNEVERPIVIEYSPALFIGGFGGAGGGGLYYSMGFDMGIPLDRLRRLEVTLGPRLNFTADTNAMMALLLGFRVGLQGQFGSTGFRLGSFVEGGGAGFTNLGAGEFGFAPYAEGGLSLGYSLGGIANFDLEVAGGGRTSDIAGPSSGEVSREFLPYFRLGASVSASF